VGGGAEAIATSPAVVTGFGWRRGDRDHGGAVGINTLNNIFGNGNSASSNKPQHGYEIVDGKGDVKKVG
jgi:hypothetical protein